MARGDLRGPPLLACVRGQVAGADVGGWGETLQTPFSHSPPFGEAWGVWTPANDAARFYFVYGHPCAPKKSLLNWLPSVEPFPMVLDGDI